MKISKLFHWLYGLVMLLPIFAIGVTCGYAMFNKNAYQSYYGEHVNDYETFTTNEPVIDKEYKIVGQVLNVSQSGAFNKLYYISNGSVSIGSYDFSYIDYFRIYSNANGNIEILAYTGSTQTYDIYLTRDGSVFTFTLSDIASYPNGALNSDDYSIFEYVEYNKVSFVSEAFYYSVDRVTQSNMFSWAYDSFLVTPFAYIVSLFSMPANSPVVMLLSYWLAISIIWLVFDLVMYIPLLVHRWLDKGVLE